MTHPMRDFKTGLANLQAIADRPYSLNAEKMEPRAYAPPPRARRGSVAGIVIAGILMGMVLGAFTMKAVGNSISAQINSHVEGFDG